VHCLDGRQRSFLASAARKPPTNVSPSPTVVGCATSSARALAGGAEQLDLLGGDRPHGLDARGLDGVRLAHLRVVSQHLAHLVVVGDLDVSRDVEARMDE
jgi:hypothetical protein